MRLNLEFGRSVVSCTAADSFELDGASTDVGLIDRRQVTAIGACSCEQHLLLSFGRTVSPNLLRAAITGAVARKLATGNSNSTTKKRLNLINLNLLLLLLFRCHVAIRDNTLKLLGDAIRHEH